MISAQNIWFFFKLRTEQFSYVMLKKKSNHIWNQMDIHWMIYERKLNENKKQEIKFEMKKWKKRKKRKCEMWLIIKNRYEIYMNKNTE